MGRGLDDPNVVVKMYGKTDGGTDRQISRHVVCYVKTKFIDKMSEVWQNIKLYLPPHIFIIYLNNKITFSYFINLFKIQMNIKTFCIFTTFRMLVVFF